MYISTFNVAKEKADVQFSACLKCQLHYTPLKNSITSASAINKSITEAMHVSHSTIQLRKKTQHHDATDVATSDGDKAQAISNSVEITSMHGLTIVRLRLHQVSTQLVQYFIVLLWFVITISGLAMPNQYNQAVMKYYMVLG